MNLPYLGIVEGKLFDEPYLITEKRSRMKIMLVDPKVDLLLEQIKKTIKKALNYCKSEEN